MRTNYLVFRLTDTSYVLGRSNSDVSVVSLPAEELFPILSADLPQEVIRKLKMYPTYELLDNERVKEYKAQNKRLRSHGAIGEKMIELSKKKSMVFVSHVDLYDFLITEAHLKSHAIPQSLNPEVLFRVLCRLQPDTYRPYCVYFIAT
jgi:hypothetical protein